MGGPHEASRAPHEGGKALAQKNQGGTSGPAYPQPSLAKVETHGVVPMRPELVLAIIGLALAAFGLTRLAMSQSGTAWIGMGAILVATAQVLVLSAQGA